MDKQKLLSWIDYGLERACKQMEYYEKDSFTHTQILGARDLLEVLLQEIEKGTFDNQEAPHAKQP